MTGRRFATGIAGAAALIAVTTLLARVAGFARILVFTDAVRAGGVGGIYQTVNAIPNVMFEVAAGGILAAVAVPLIAHRLGAGERDRAEHTASVLLSWTLLVLTPLAALLWLLAGPIAGWLVVESDSRARKLPGWALWSVTTRFVVLTTSGSSQATRAPRRDFGAPFGAQTPITHRPDAGHE